MARPRALAALLVASASLLPLPHRAHAQHADDDTSDPGAPPAAPDPDPDPDPAPEPDPDLDLDAGAVHVVGSAIVDPDAVPVPSFTVDEDDLRRRRPLSATEAVRDVPGITARDEEGAGLRPNLGFRGLPPDRSRNVLVLEDGMPIQMMPYDYPELYVSPRIERMRSVEVVRGAGQILYGPRTIGAVVNYLTLEPPERLRLTGEVRYGTDGYFLGTTTAGDTVGDVGFLITFLHQRFDGPRHLDIALWDAMGRLTLDLHDAGQLRVKLHFYDEDSRSTQLGLTQVQWQNGVYDSFAVNDRFPIRRYTAQLTHSIALVPEVDLVTTAYFHTTTRDWWRQDFLRTSAEGAPIDRIVDGFGSTLAPGTPVPSDGSAVFFLSTNTGRTRQYTVAGLEPRVTARYDLGLFEGEIVGGARIHVEGSRDLDVAGDSPTARTGEIRSEQERSVIALAAYLRPTFEFFDRKLEIAPGIRIESMWSSIAVQRRIATPGGVVDGAYQRAISETLEPPGEDHADLVAIIPGVSATARLHDGAIVYGGVHRGFVPPGVRDAILGDARNAQLSPEYAWSWELGVRGQPASWLRYEATAFLIDYDNQVLSPTESGTDDLTTGGRTESHGVELSGAFDLARALGADFEVPLTVAYTWADARFGQGWARGIAGNRLPYVPEHTLSARLDFVHPIGLEAQVALQYLSAQFADPWNTIEPTLDGLAGPIEARATLDARIGYTYEPWGVSVYFDARNLLDTRYVASRAPAGINPGMTRQLFGGVRIRY